MSEFSRIFKVTNLKNPKRFSIVTDANEAIELTQRLKVKTLNTLSVNGVLSAKQNGLIHVQAELTADLVQECIVSLEDVEEHINEPFDELYKIGDQSQYAEIDEETEWDDIITDTIDVGEIAVQYLSLALNPYPRKEDLDLYVHNEDEPDDTTQKLIQLKKKLEKAS